MEYNVFEKQALDTLGRTDFKAIRKQEMVNINSMLYSMRPEVAMEAIKQFPELSNLLQTSMSQYANILDKVVDSDDASVRQVYSAVEKAMDDAKSGREQFYQFAEKVHADHSKYLEQEDATSAERAEILKDEMEILRMADAKEKEVRQQQEIAANAVDRKDSEKRQFHLSVTRFAHAALAVIVCVGIVALGGKFSVGNN